MSYDYYVCRNCGVVTTDPDYCQACGEYDLESAGLSGGDGSHECDECGESFGSAASLRGHEASAHGGE